MEIKKLIHFQAVINSGSFRTAAEQVHISPPALTKSIQALEAQVGETLFERHRRQLTLTEAGLLLSQRCQRVLDEFASMQQSLDELKQRRTNMVRLGCGPVVAYSFLPRSLSLLHRENPQVQVALTIANSDRLISLLKAGELDLVVADLRALKPCDADLVTEALPTEPVCWIAGSQHPLAREREVHLEELVGFPMVLPTLPGTLTGAMEECYGSRVADAIRRPYIEVDDCRMILELSRANTSIAMAHENMARDATRNLGLRMLPVSNFQLSTFPGLISRRDTLPSSTRLALIAAFRAVGEAPKIPTSMPTNHS